MLNKLKNKKSFNGTFTASNYANLGNYVTGRATVSHRKQSGLKNVSAADFFQKESSINHLLAFQSKEDFARLEPHLENVFYDAGEYLYRSDEYSGYLYFPETAVISHLHSSADGKTVEIAMIGREGVSGLCEIFGSQP